jgi:hypothetical protein
MANLPRRRSARGTARHARNAKIAGSQMDRIGDYVHFAERNQTNSLIELNNGDASGRACSAAAVRCKQGLK